ncbi:DUF6406 domain-containing protein [Krasilnikovia sp. MM14-A1259]|uniref:DUF6406 domain-containing protein n=1 Tax=Krasilnikovia sp. MM14-A1259 TaxID=3373539 RepID=UPI00399D1AB5
MEPDDRVVWINQATVGWTPAGDIGIMGATTVPEPRVNLAVMSHDRSVSTKHLLMLGETFPIGDELWRLADIDFRSATDYSVCIRRVDANEPQDPPTGHVWQDAEFRAHSTLSEAQLSAAEAQLGLRLPKVYRDWLGRNNGAQPVQPYRLGGWHFLLTPERPLFGLHPEYPAFDLMAAQRTWRDPYLTRDHLVIATPGGIGGLLTVKVGGADVDMIGYLSPDAMTGQLDPADRVRLLRGVARDLGYFLGSLVSYEPEGPPARVVQPGDPDYRPMPG